MSFKGFSELRRFALLVAMFLTSIFTFAQSEPETTKPLTDMEVMRKVAVLDIEGKTYENVTISFKSTTPDYFITDKYKVKVKVVDENGKSIYKKTLKNAFLYVFLTTLMCHEDFYKSGRSWSLFTFTKQIGNESLISSFLSTS